MISLNDYREKYITLNVYIYNDPVHIYFINTCFLNIFNNKYLLIYYTSKLYLPIKKNVTDCLKK